MQRLDIAATGRDNNLNLLRFLAASAVVYAHAYGIQHATDHEPFNIVFGYGLGDFAVDVFFFLSGLLVCKSWLARQNVVDFVWARCVRVLPALWLSNVFFACVFGAFFTTLSLAEYYAPPAERKDVR